MHLLLLFSAGLLGGIVNSLAGGATFFTFPALLLSGLSPIVANASNTVALAPANFFALLSLRKDLPKLQAKLLLVAAIGMIGSSIGVWAVLASGDRLFQNLIPFLLLGATLLFIAAPYIQNLHADRLSPRTRRIFSVSIIALAALYGGYFGAGMGIMLITAITLAGHSNIRQANALKNLMALFVSVTAVMLFIYAGKVAWTETLAMMLGAISGGIVGGHLAKTIPVKAVRWLVIGMGTLLSIVYLKPLLN